MRCPTCQATNPDSATFCGQCYMRFEHGTASADPLPRRDGSDPEDLPEWLAVGAPDEPATGDVASADPPGPDPRPATVGRFHSDGVAVGWTCVVCGEDNPMAEFSCTVCGTRMDAEVDHASAVDWPAARRVEAFVPGLGHVRAGSGGMGMARTAMVLLWGLGAAVLATAGGAGLLAALPLLVGVLVIWVTGPSDLDALRAGREPRLNARVFLYLVIGVTVGVVALGGLAAAL